jgi:hypothetical protein
MLRAILTLSLLVSGLVLFAQRVVIYPDQVIQCHYYGTSEPLRDKAQAVPADAKKMYPNGIVPNNFIKRKYRFENDRAPASVDPVAQSVNGTKQMQQGLIQNFEGMNRFNSGGAIPPDCSGDVGPNHYVQMVNLAFQVFDKSGNSLYGPVANSVIFDGWDDGEAWDNTNDGDPIVLYDDQADRWIVSHFSLPNWSAPYYMLVAYSATSDPMGAYHRYAFQLNNFPDYPKLGIWRDGIYITFNSNTGQAAVFERDSMLIGAPARMIQFSIPDYPGNGFRSALAADCDGEFAPEGTPNYLVYYNDNAWGSYPTDHLRIWQFNTNWNTPSSSTLALASTLITQPFDSNFPSNWNNITQPGSQKLDALAQAMMFRLQYRRFPTHETMLCNYVVDVNGSDHAGIRWYELRKDVGSWYIYQQGTYAPDSHNRWNASMAMDKDGNIGMGYSVSSSTVYPSLRFTGQTKGAPLGVMDLAEQLIIAGGGSQTGTNRFGDYATMGVDPTDDMTFWFNSEYIPSGGNWRSRIASFKFDEIIVPAINAGPSELVSPQTSSFLTSNESVQVKLENYGLDTIFSLPVSYQVNQSTIVNEIIIDTIPPQSSYNHTFSLGYDFSAEGIYSLTIITSLPGDTIPQDDTLYAEIEHTEPIYCDASGATGGEFISQVQFHDTTFISTSSAYSDQLSDTLVMKQGGVYEFLITIVGGTAYNQLLVWFDWNSDKDFEDAGEEYNFGTGVGPFSASVTVPLDAVMGDSRVRMRLHDTQNGPNYTPCGVSTYGEVVDFTLRVVDPLGNEIIIPNEINLVVHPNPTLGDLKISLPSLPYDAYIQLIDASGREKYRKELKSGTPLSEFPVTMKELPAGLYFIRLRLDNDLIIKVEKLIKQ